MPNDETIEFDVQDTPFSQRVYPPILNPQVPTCRHSCSMCASGQLSTSTYHPSKKDPALWFLQVEAQFRSYTITEEHIKADIIIGDLPADAIQRIQRSLYQLPIEQPYQFLKTSLVTAYAGEKPAQLSRLFSSTWNQNQRPSEIYDICAMGQNYVNEEGLRTLWIEKLPTTLKIAVMT